MIKELTSTKKMRRASRIEAKEKIKSRKASTKLEKRKQSNCLPVNNDAIKTQRDESNARQSRVNGSKISRHSHSAHPDRKERRN